MNNGSRALLLGVLVFSIVLNLVQAVIGSRSMGSSPAPGAAPAAAVPSSAPAGDFEGQVDFHMREVVRGEDLIQIIDKTRGVICYGKMNVAGAATISCQRYQ